MGKCQTIGRAHGETHRSEMYGASTLVQISLSANARQHACQTYLRNETGQRMLRSGPPEPRFQNQVISTSWLNILAKRRNTSVSNLSWSSAAQFFRLEDNRLGAKLCNMPGASARKQSGNAACDQMQTAILCDRAALPLVLYGLGDLNTIDRTELTSGFAACDLRVVEYDMPSRSCNGGP